MLKRNVGGPGLSLVLFLLLVVVRVTAQSVPGGPPPTDAGWGAGGLSGLILSSTGQRFSRRISVRLRSMAKGDRVAMTDDKGTFVFTGVPNGDYVVIVDKEQGFEPYSENVQIIAGAAPHLVIRLSSKGEAKSEPGVINAEFANVPPRALAFYQKAMEQAQAGNNKAAIEQLQKAIAEYSNFMLAFNELGLQYLRLGELDKADEALAKAQKLAPDSATPLLTHGILLTVMGKFNLAGNGVADGSEAERPIGKWPPLSWPGAGQPRSLCRSRSSVNACD